MIIKDSMSCQLTSLAEIHEDEEDDSGMPEDIPVWILTRKGLQRKSIPGFPRPCQECYSISTKLGWRTPCCAKNCKYKKLLNDNFASEASYIS